jgi:NAD(P)H-dependent FMN reductase
MAGKRLLIVWQSTTGATEQVARAVADAASTAGGIDVRLQHASQTHSADVLEADGYVFASPEYLASMGGLMKDFLDRCYYDILDQINGRPCAVTVCAGSDGQGAVRQIERILTGWRLRLIAPPLLICTQAQTRAAIQAAKRVPANELERAIELGATFAAGLSGGIF